MTTTTAPPLPRPPALAKDYDRLPNRSALRAFVIGASTVADPWAGFFEDGPPWGSRSGFWRDRLMLTYDVWRVTRQQWESDEISELRQDRLFDLKSLV